MIVGRRSSCETADDADGEPEVVDALAIEVDRRHEAHDDEVVAGGAGLRDVEDERHPIGCLGEQAQHRPLEADPVGVDAVDDRGDAVDHVGGVGDLDVDERRLAGNDGEVRLGECRLHSRTPPLSGTSAVSGGSVSTTISSPTRARTRKRPELPTTVAPIGDRTVAPTASGDGLRRRPGGSSRWCRRADPAERGRDAVDRGPAGSGPPMSNSVREHHVQAGLQLTFECLEHVHVVFTGGGHGQRRRREFVERVGEELTIDRPVWQQRPDEAGEQRPLVAVVAGPRRDHVAQSRGTAAPVRRTPAPSRSTVR